MGFSSEGQVDRACLK